MDASARIFALGIDHRNGSPDDIACAAFDAESTARARTAALNAGANEAFVISTCNRVEIYVAGVSEKLFDACMAALTLDGARSVDSISDKLKEYGDLEAVTHLYETACGIDSQMIGENEILGQIKNAYADALESKHLGAVLNRTLQKAIQCAKWIRTNTQIGVGNTTIGAVVAELASRIFDDFSEKNILLAGSGEVGKSVALALAARGAKRIAVSSRTWENAYSLSNEIGGGAIPFERVGKELQNFDIAIFALSNAAETVSFDDAMRVSELRKNNPLFFVDLGIPKNISPKAAELPNIFLYDIADLAKQANENIELRKGEIDRAKIEIAKRASYLWERITR